jgi:hypothetical protein
VVFFDRETCISTPVDRALDAKARETIHRTGAHDHVEDEEPAGAE